MLTNYKERNARIMKLVDMTVTGYLEDLMSNSPAPGGGSVSALSGAQGAALAIMVADLTIGREKFAEFEDVCKETKEEMLKIYEELKAGVDLDTDAFMKVANAYKLPKETDEEKALRSKEIREANVGATEVPFHTVELSLKGLKLMKNMAGKYNPNCDSDFGVAAISFMVGCYGAWLNVKINLSGVKDEELKEKFSKAYDMMKEAETICNELYFNVEANI